MDRFRQDVRFGIRMLVKSPGFTIPTVLILALGIGVNTAIFSVLNALLWQAPAYKDPDRVMVLWEKLKETDQLELSPDDYRDYRDTGRVFEHLTACKRSGFNLTGGDEPLRIEGSTVTGNLFSTLGVAPMLGRAFVPEDDQPGAVPVVVLSHGLWQRHFGGDRGLVGRSVKLDGQAHTVIGVMPPDFAFPPPMAQNGPMYEVKSEVWVPRLLERETRPNSHGLFVVGRLREGVTSKQAVAELEAFGENRRRIHPDTHSDIGVNPLSIQDQTARRIKPALMILLGAVGFVLLIACANVANLFLIRATARRRELAVREALGAGRSRILRQLLTEGMVLALFGGGLGLLLAFWTKQALIVFGADRVLPTDRIGIDLRAAGFAFGVSVLTGIVFSVVPAFKAAGLDVVRILKDGTRGSSGGGNRVRFTLVVIETALAMTLLIGAGLLMKSHRNLLDVDPGFRPDHLLVMETTLPDLKYDTPERQAAFYRQVIEKIASLPGVVSASVVNNPPLSGRRGVDGFLIEGRPEPTSVADTPLADYRAVGPEYFGTMEIPVTAGRPFENRDAADAPRTAIVNEAAAKRWWSGENPIGKRIWVKDEWRTIVGIVGDVRQSGPDSNAATHVYVPFFQVPQGRMGIVARTASEPDALASSVRQAVASVDREVAPYSLQAMEQVVERSISQRKFNMLLLGSFAGLALALAAVGLYATVAYSVGRRTGEFGIRLALGAQRGDVARMVVGQGMATAGLGIAVGLAAALVVTRAVESLLFGVKPLDPVVFAVVSAGVLIVSAAASYLPARRAAKTDPLTALRSE